VAENDSDLALLTAIVGNNIHLERRQKYLDKF
jgi:hypothetical protein